jgi:NAD(P)-dependent dehydrogenase (short-subunit alcohol dehydrogenase family)
LTGPLRALAITDGGRIINIVTALLGAYTPFYTLYQGSKAPVEWFTKGLSKELLSRGISVNAIAPGEILVHLYVFPISNSC